MTVLRGFVTAVSVALAAFPALAQDRQTMVWDAGRRCFRPPEAERCGITWNVHQRRYTGDAGAVTQRGPGDRGGSGGTPGSNGPAARSRAAQGGLGQGLDAEIRQQLETTAGAVIDAYTLGQAEGLARLIGESGDGPGGGPQAGAIRQILQRANGNVDR